MLQEQTIYQSLLSECYSRYRDYVLKTLKRGPLAKPWMRRREILVIEEILTRLMPQQCLEWGAGYGSLRFPRALALDVPWHSVEHNPDWAKKIRELNQRQATQIHCFEFDPDDSLPSGDSLEYISFPAQLGQFDFILVDGRHRSECLRQAYELVSDRGVVVVHDANRPRYHQAISVFPKQLALLDWRKDEGGIWIVSKERELDSVLDCDHHRRLWSFTARYGMFLRM